MHYKQYKTILSPNNGMNVYRGCTHGCIYCDARSKCYGMKHDFCDIEVKENAAALLESELLKKRRKCMIGTGAMCDPYIPLEERLNVTRKCLEVILKHGFGLAVQTKSDRILRDLDCLKAIHKKAKCVVQMTLTTFDEELCRLVEPNVCTTKKRFETLKIFRDNGIPTVVWLSPVLPLINDTEENLRGILSYCIEANVKGILCFGMGTTLREGDREYFFDALDRHFPGVKQSYLRLYGNSYECLSAQNAALMKLFYSECAKHGISTDINEIFSYLREFPAPPEAKQLTLF